MNPEIQRVFGPLIRSVKVTGAVKGRRGLSSWARQKDRRANHVPYLAAIEFNGILIEQAKIYIRRNFRPKKNIPLHIDINIHEKQGHQYFICADWTVMANVLDRK